MTERQELGSLEAMLFAHAEPVETARLADALRLDTDETTELLQKLIRATADALPAPKPKPAKKARKTTKAKKP